MHEILNQGAFSLFFIRTSRAMWEYQSEIRTKSLKIDHAHIEVLSDFCLYIFTLTYVTNLEEQNLHTWFPQTSVCVLSIVDIWD